MKHHRFLLLASAMSLAILTLIGWLAFSPSFAARAQMPTEEPDLATISEVTGLEASKTALSPACTFDKTFEVYLCPPTLPQTLPIPNPANKTQALQILGSSGLLLIPDSTTKRVMAFDPISGDLVDADFIPADPTNLATPIQAIFSTHGTLLVSDQLNDVVQEYDLDGNYLGIFAPAGGVNNAILDNIRGIQLRENGNLLVTVGSGSNADSVAEFDTNGNYLGNFVGIGSGGIASPFDVEQRTSDWLVAGINSDAIHRYDLAGVYIANFSGVDNFPEQMDEISSGNVLVANFSGTQEGVMEFQADGTLVGVYDTATTGGYRGAYELPNGNILTTTGSGVYEIDRAGNVVEAKIEGVSARFIQFVNLAPSITLNKTVGTNPTVCANTDTVAVAPGAEVTYCYKITNTGVVTLTRHDLVDSELGSILSDFPFTLLPGASAFLTETATILTNTVNTATWTAYNPGPTDVVSATDTASVTILTPEIQLNKTVGTDPSVCAATDTISVMPGTEATYCYEIINTGEITLTRHDLVDNELGSLLINFPFTLIPGASAFITQTVMITETTVNTATWTAYNPGPTDVAVSSDTATVSILKTAPAIEVSPGSLAGSQLPNQTVTWNLVISNTGTGDLVWNIIEATEVNAPRAEPPSLGLPNPAIISRIERTSPALPTALSPLDVLYDQTSNVANGAITSQEFEEAFAAYTNQAADDFVIPAEDGAWTVEHVYVAGEYTSGTMPFVNVYFYEDNGGLPAETAFYTYDGLTSFTDISGTLTIDLGTPAILPAGTYWVSVQADMDALTEGQWFWAEHFDQVNNASAWRNPGNGFGYNCQDWATRTSCNVGTNPDMAFQLLGSIGGLVCSAPSDIPWVTVSPTEGTTASGTASPVTVTVDSTGLSAGVYTGTLCVNSNAPTAPFVAVPLTLTVVAPTYGVELSSNPTASGNPGETIQYVVTLTNTGNVTDTFDLAGAGVWAAALSETSVTLGAGQSTTFTVEVTIPANAVENDSDVTTITATSQGDGTVTDSINLTTTAVTEGTFIYLPIVTR